MIPRILLIIILAFSIQIDAMNAPSTATPPASTSLTLSHRKRDAEPLYMELGPKLEEKAAYQILALTEQVDRFSCVYRALFHARCIDIANKRDANKKADFNASMQELLLNVGMMEAIYQNIKDYLDSYQTSWDRTKGIAIAFIPAICALKLRKLHGKILITMLEDDGSITVLHDKNASPANPLQYSHKFILNCGEKELPFDQCKAPIDKSIELHYQLAKLCDPFQTAHFMCRYPSHAFLITLRTNAEGKVSLYAIDSDNRNVYKTEHFKKLATKFTSYLAAKLNNKKTNP